MGSRLIDHSETPARPHPEEDVRFSLIAIAVGTAARILVRYGFNADESAALVREAWEIVQR